MKKSQNNKQCINVTRALIIITIAFIFLQSMFSQQTSSQESGFILKLLRPILEWFVGTGNVTEHLVRKLAHFTEYGFLGHLFSAYVFCRYEKIQKNYFIICTVLLWLVAFLDETIQIFSHRGPMIQDVWLDLAGGICGILLVLAVRTIASKRARTKEGKQCD